MTRGTTGARLCAFLLFALAGASSLGARTPRVDGEGQEFDALLVFGAFALAAVVLIIVLPRGTGKRKWPEQLGTDEGPDED